MKRKPKPVDGYTLLILCLTFLLFSACKEKIEGCTDLAATNWNAAADRACESCCSYPNLKLTLEHTAGDTSLIYGDQYTDDFGNAFRITSIRYFLSDFRLWNDQATYLVSDSTDMDVVVNGEDTTLLVKDDFVFVTRSNTSTTIGEFITGTKSLDSLHFKLGITQPANSSDPASLPSSHALAPKSDSMYWDATNGYIFQRIGLVPNTVTGDTILLEIGGDDLLQSVNLAFNVYIPAGTDLTVPLTVDYLDWFTGINFVEDAQEVWKEKIVTNLSKSFSITP